jgi:diguanylate cyclase (GGDEF)-like protein
MGEEDKQLLKDLGAMIEQEIKSIEMATVDELTLIYNRRGFLTLVDYCQKRCRRDKKSISFVLFDLNKFKKINDEHGHHEGDLVLTTFAQTLVSCFRECDVVGRQGGDEFIAMLSDVDNKMIQPILDRLEQAVCEQNESLNKPYKIEYSTGVAHFDSNSDLTIEKMINQADEAMYLDKKDQET